MGFKGTPPARQHARYWPGSEEWTRHHRRDRGNRRGPPGAGREQQGGSPTPGLRPAAPFRTGAIRARRRRADAPHAQAGGPRRYAPAMTAPARVVGSSSPRGALSHRRRSQSRTLAARASLPRWRCAPPLSSDLPGKTRHLSGERGEKEDVRSQTSTPRSVYRSLKRNLAKARPRSFT
jgi:hypothetical protein